VLAKHFHLILLVSTLDVDGRVRLRIVVDTEPYDSGTPGADATYRGYTAGGSTTWERKRFCGGGGTTTTGGARRRSGRNIGKRRSAEILNAKTT
jgi:hypothetical protein